MTDITETPGDAPAPKPVIRRIMDTIEEVVEQRERAAADAARAEAATVLAVAQPAAPPARKPPRYAWNDLWTIERAPAGPVADTETLLNGLIDECGFLMREVAFRLVQTAPDRDEAVAFLGRAMALATTGAEVGLAVAKLRKASIAESRQSITLERFERVPEIEKPSIRANNDQDVAS
jgi:hypothetical protein